MNENQLYCHHDWNYKLQGRGIRTYYRNCHKCGLKQTEVLDLAYLQKGWVEVE